MSHSRPSISAVTYPRIQPTGDRIGLYLLKKSMHISGPVQVKPVLRGQLYSSTSTSELHILVPAPSLSLLNL